MISAVKRIDISEICIHSRTRRGLQLTQVNA